MEEGSFGLDRKFQVESKTKDERRKESDVGRPQREKRLNTKVPQDEQEISSIADTKEYTKSCTDYKEDLNPRNKYKNKERKEVCHGVTTFVIKFDDLGVDLKVSRKREVQFSITPKVGV